MAERRVSIRLGVIGGKEVEATFESLGTKGAGAMKRLGDASEQASDKVARGSGRMGSAVQNLGFQVGDFAVQVGNGTSASVALSQQLPQLLGAFGPLSAVLGALVAIGIPLGAFLLGINTKSKTAAEGVKELEEAVGRLKDQQSTYSTEGIQAYIEKYGELNAAVLLLIQRQREFAQGEAKAAATTAVKALKDEITGGFFSGLINSDRDEVAAALGVGRTIGESLRMGVVEQTDQIYLDYKALLDRIEKARAAGDGEGLLLAQEQLSVLLNTLNPQVDQFAAALEAAASAGTGSFEEQAAAVADLSGLIQGTALEGTKFAGTLLDAESALRELNHQGDGIGGWLGAAIDWASSLAGNLWDGAAAAAAIRGAQAAKDTPLSRYDAMVEAMNIGGKGRGQGPSSAGPTFHRADGTVFDPNPPASRGGRAGGSASATSDLEREAARIFESTRTETEKYASELERLNQIKDAGLITGDTYNRQLEALGERYKAEEDGLKSIQAKLDEFVKSSANLADGIGGALVDAFSAGSDAVGEFVRTGKLDMNSLITSFIVDMARLASQRFIFGPLAGMLSGALAGILHDGGLVGRAGGSRSVDASVFTGARRMHAGGVAGLAGDEVPAILQRGERVLSKRQNAAYESGGSPTIIFNVKDAASVRQSRSQIAADAARAVAMGRRNS